MGAVVNIFYYFKILLLLFINFLNKKRGKKIELHIIWIDINR